MHESTYVGGVWLVQIGDGACVAVVVFHLHYRRDEVGGLQIDSRKGVKKRRSGRGGSVGAVGVQDKGKMGPVGK